jgi:hypothetical protein
MVSCKSYSALCSLKRQSIKLSFSVFDVYLFHFQLRTKPHDPALSSNKSKQAAKPADVAVVSAKDIATMREELNKGKGPRDAGIVAVSELARIKASTKI